MYSGTLLTQSTMPVASAGMRSVDDSTTGWSPAVRHAFTRAGSPPSVNTFAFAISSGVRYACLQKKLAVPTRVHWRATRLRSRSAESMRPLTRSKAHWSWASSWKRSGAERAWASGTTSWRPTFVTAAAWSWPTASLRTMSLSPPWTPPG